MIQHEIDSPSKINCYNLVYIILEGNKPQTTSGGTGFIRPAALHFSGRGLACARAGLYGFLPVRCCKRLFVSAPLPLPRLSVRDSGGTAPSARRSAFPAPLSMPLGDARPAVHHAVKIASCGFVMGQLHAVCFVKRLLLFRRLPPVFPVNLAVLQILLGV